MYLNPILQALGAWYRRFPLFLEGDPANIRLLKYRWLPVESPIASIVVRGRGSFCCLFTRSDKFQEVSSPSVGAEVLQLACLASRIPAWLRIGASYTHDGRGHSVQNDNLTLNIPSDPSRFSGTAYTYTRHCVFSQKFVKFRWSWRRPLAEIIQCGGFSVE